MKFELDNVDPAVMDILIRQRNLKSAWAGRFEFTDAQREHLYALCFEEWSVNWLCEVQKP